MAKYTKKFVKELCVQLRFIREQKDIPLQQVLDDLDIKETTMEQVEKHLSSGLKTCHRLMEYYGYQIKLIPNNK